MGDTMPEQTTGRDHSNLYIPAAIVIAGALVGGAVYFSLAPQAGNGGGSAAAPTSVDVKDVKTDGRPFVGSANAPLTMAYWFDYQCPFCKQFETTVLPTLMTKYVDTGKLRIVFKDFAFLGPDSTTAALYEHAVWDLYPSKFFEWNEAMYKAQDEEHGGFGNEASILTLSATISGVDASALKTRVAAKRDAYQKDIDADQQEGASFGIGGTPGFIVGTQSIDGAQQLSVFTAAIDSQLK